MAFIILLFSLLLLIGLIVMKVNPMLALLVVTIVSGLLLGMPVSRLLLSMNKGIGDTLASVVMVIALGAMLGKLAEKSGAVQQIVRILVHRFGIRHIQWAVLCTSLLAGIPLFYNAGFVILFPLVFAIASSTGLPLLYVGIPMAASLSVTHGFLPPHPGPVTLIGLFQASMGKTVLYGLALSIPIAIICGILFPRQFLRIGSGISNHSPTLPAVESKLPSTFKSFLLVLSPVLFIMIGTIGNFLSLPEPVQPAFNLLQDPSVAMLLSLLLTLLLLQWRMQTAMQACVNGVTDIAMIILIIAAGGAFKQVLVDSQIGMLVRDRALALHIAPLFMGWFVAALFRVSLGSASVAAIAAAGIVSPFITTGVSPELMVLSVGAGSLMCSHVNDTGFWMFKEYFGLTLKQTFLTWTLVESLISVLGLMGVLLIDWMR